MSIVDDAQRLAETVELRAALDRTLRQLDKANSKGQDLVDAVYRAAKDAASALIIVPVPKPVPDRRKGHAEVAVAILSDWQLGKKTPTSSSDVCEQRVAQYADKVIKLANIQRSNHPVREVRVWLLGDLVEGELIFPGQAHRIDSSLYRQVTLDGPRILANFLRKMLGSFDRVHVTAVIGNHGAIGGPVRRESHPETNADTMLYRIVNQIVVDPRLTWNIADPAGERGWYAIDEIGTFRSLLFHGDQIRGGFAGFPLYGLAKKVWGWQSGAVPESFTHAALGHWHTPDSKVLNHTVIWVNGSTESDNTYAQEQLAASGRPCQWLLFIDPEKGRATAEYRVWLD